MTRTEVRRGKMAKVLFRDWADFQSEGIQKPNSPEAQPTIKVVASGSIDVQSIETGHTWGGILA